MLQTKYKILIWENIASPHQSFFFKALAEHPNIDLKVRYFEKFHTERKAMGWQDNITMPEIEAYVEPDITIALATVPDWQERIHIIPGNSYKFTRKLINIFIQKKIKWIHWSERGGIVLAKILKFKMNWYNFLYPLYAKMAKFNYAYQINNTALGALGQGELAIQTFIKWGVKPQKTGVLFYTIAPITSINYPKDLLKRNGLLFIYVGSLVQWKGLDFLFNSFAQISNDRDDTLVLIGDGPLKQKLEKQAKSLEILNKVQFLGTKSIYEVPNYIAHCDVLVLPSLFDGWGAVLNEASALGKPIIATNQCGAAYHIIENGKNGFVVPAGNTKALAEAMKKYINNPNLIKIHGKNSKERYERYFTPQKNVERLLKQLEKWGVKT